MIIGIGSIMLNSPVQYGYSLAEFIELEQCAAPIDQKHGCIWGQIQRLVEGPNGIT